MGTDIAARIQALVSEWHGLDQTLVEGAIDDAGLLCVDEDDVEGTEDRRDQILVELAGLAATNEVLGLMQEEGIYETEEDAGGGLILILLKADECELARRLLTNKPFSLNSTGLLRGWARLVMKTRDPADIGTLRMMTQSQIIDEAEPRVIAEAHLTLWELMKDEGDLNAACVAVDGLAVYNADRLRGFLMIADWTHEERDLLAAAVGLQDAVVPLEQQALHYAAVLRTFEMTAPQISDHLAKLRNINQQFGDLVQKALEEGEDEPTA